MKLLYISVLLLVIAGTALGCAQMGETCKHSIVRKDCCGRLKCIDNFCRNPHRSLFPKSDSPDTFILALDSKISGVSESDDTSSDDTSSDDSSSDSDSHKPCSSHHKHSKSHSHSKPSKPCPPHPSHDPHSSFFDSSSNPYTISLSSFSSSYYDSLSFASYDPDSSKSHYPCKHRKHHFTTDPPTSSTPVPTQPPSSTTVSYSTPSDPAPCKRGSSTSAPVTSPTDSPVTVTFHPLMAMKYYVKVDTDGLGFNKSHTGDDFYNTLHEMTSNEVMDIILGK